MGPYLVDVVGFDNEERTMLASVFALAARRDPGFVQYDPLSQETAQLYVVDVEDAAAFDEFRALNRHACLPAVLVGSCEEAQGLVVVPRPVQWARLIQAMEEAIDAGEETLPAPLEVPEAAGWSGAPLSASGSGAGRSRPGRPDAPAHEVRSAVGDAVLVVDDNATVRNFMQAKLAPYRFEVDIAESGEQAIGLTGTREYACVFLDVVLPGIDGYQVCKLIKSNRNAIKKTAVVMLTSRGSPFDKLRGSLAGCDEYLTKPLDEHRLLEVIARFLPRGRERAHRSRHPR